MEQRLVSPSDTVVAEGSGREAKGSAATISIERCPVCRSKVLVKLPGEVVIRNAILRVDGPTGRVSAKCSRCKHWVEVPLRYTG